MNDWKSINSKIRLEKESIHFLISGQARKIWKRECFLDPQIFLSPIFGKEVIQENYFSLL